MKTLIVTCLFSLFCTPIMATPRGIAPDNWAYEMGLMGAPTPIEPMPKIAAPKLAETYSETAVDVRIDEALGVFYVKTDVGSVYVFDGKTNEASCVVPRGDTVLIGTYVVNELEETITFFYRANKTVIKF